jgi:hypothetical protein
LLRDRSRRLSRVAQARAQGAESLFARVWFGPNGEIEWGRRRSRLHITPTGRRGLMDTIAAIVGTLDRREIFQSIISHTGRKHAEFGVQTAHFVAFGDALIWGLQQQFGPAFTPEMQQAWIVLYDAIQAEMMRAANTP